MTRQGTPIIGLVDPIRTARAFIGELERRNIECINLESGLLGEIPSVKGQIVRATPTIAMMAEKLRRLNVTRLIGCVDPSLVYTDNLCAQLGLPFNGLRLSEARRNKVLMNNVVRNANLRAPFQYECTTLDDLLLWTSKAGYPCVIKPVSSGGTDNVYLCNSDKQAADCFHRIHNCRNLFGVVNTSVLVQEYVDGIEYAVDCVSFDGTHICIDCFEYQKGVHNGRHFIYEKERFLRSENPAKKRLEAFAQQILGVLDFRTGASHMELKINSDDEIVFIEVGARLNGEDMHRLVQDTREDGKSQLEYTIDSVLDKPPPERNYKTIKDGIRVYFHTDKDGVLKEITQLDRIKALRSYTRIDLHATIGQKTSSTVDLVTNAGWVDLTHTDPEVLRADEKRLDAIIAEGMFTFE